MSDGDLFGRPIIPDGKMTAAGVRRNRGSPKPRGYAAPPGTGPAGERCRSCEHAHRAGSRSGKTWWKCALNKAKWTHSVTTDIRLKSPVCSKWQAKAPAPGDSSP